MRGRPIGWRRENTNAGSTLDGKNNGSYPNTNSEVITEAVDQTRSWDSGQFTLIVPVRIDSQSRYINLQTMLRFVLKEYDAKIIVTESDASSKLQSMQELKHPRVTYLFETSSKDFFHRTRILNDMLLQVQTPFVANWDCDMIIPRSTFNEVCYLLDQGYNLVYPYKRGSPLRGINPGKELNAFINNPTNELIEPIRKVSWLGSHISALIPYGLPGLNTVGGVQFFRTKSYINGYGENESFIDWGCEDHERCFRFHMLGYKIAWVPAASKCSEAYHMHHPPTVISTKHREGYNLRNRNLWSSITSTVKTKQDLLSYLYAQPYVTKFIDRKGSL